MSAVVRGEAGRSRAAELAVRLRDLWTAGDDAVKEDVAVAWGLSPVFESGGREALRVAIADGKGPGAITAADRKSTRLNSSHVEISYAVFCLKKKKKNEERTLVLV